MRILVVTAHPDDVDFGAGGSVATWVAEGHTVGYCLCTSGEAGEAPADVARSEVAALREAEQRRAAACLGVDHVEFLRHPDGRLVADLSLRRDISRAIRSFRPDRVVCQSPERSFDRIFASHPDHLAAGEAALAAVYPDSRNPWAHPELLEQGHEPWTVKDVLVMGAPAAGSGGEPVAVDVTDALDKKVAALRAHASQTSAIDDLDGMMRGWAAMNAAAAGLATGRLAEVFRRIVTG